MSDDPRVRVCHISKRYGSVRALKHIDLDIPRQSIIGLVGPNGAGKTTLIDIIATIQPPTSGWITMGEYAIPRDSAVVRRQIGYMPDPAGLYDEMTAREYLEFFAELFGVENRGATVRELLGLVDLNEKTDERIEGLSRGMRQRLSLARCLVHNPDLLLLDEPAAGLDPRGRRLILELLGTLRDMGKTIVVASHILLELTKVCDFVAILDDGALVLAGPAEELMERARSCRRVVAHIGANAGRMVTVLEECDAVASHWCDGERVLFNFTGDDAALASLFNEVVRAGVELAEFREEPITLEHVFVDAVQQSSS